MKESMKTYLVRFENGTEQKITVPDSWKVTFGPAARGPRGGVGISTHNPKMPMDLRFYESDTKQRAIFTDVVYFRDTAIKVEEKKVNIQEKEGYMECEGTRKRTTFQARTTEWVNPDIVSETPLLPSDAQIFEKPDYNED